MIPVVWLAFGLACVGAAMCYTHGKSAPRWCVHCMETQVASREGQLGGYDTYEDMCPYHREMAFPGWDKPPHQAP